MAEKIQVTTELLPEKSEAWNEILGKMKNAEDRAEEIIKTLEEGLCAEFMQVLINKLLALSADRKEQLLDIKAHVDTLSEIAGNYGEAERSNTLGYGQH